MDKRSKIALYSIGVIIILLIIAEITKPKAINWRDSYSASDKIPLGCYVIYNELPSISAHQITTSNKSIFETLKEIPDTSKTSLIFINNYITIEEEGAQALLNYVKKGNSVFISSSYLYGTLADTLNLELDRNYGGLLKNPSRATFTNKRLKANERVFKDVIENSYITSIDTTNTIALGYMLDEEEDIKELNFIKTSYGTKNGAFYIHTNPFAFSNYHMLDKKSDYAASVLSYLPKNPIIWDNYYKSGRKVVTSPLRFVLTNPALKWAFYISLISLILFVVFKGKRTQRIIPVIEPLKNSTVAFTQTIGDLYFQHGDYSNIIHKKITYFLEFLRANFYLNTTDFNDRFIQKLAIKSSNSIQDTKTLIDFITYLKSKQQHNEKELIELNKLIENFTKNKNT